MTRRRPIPPLIETATAPRVRLRDWILTVAAWAVGALLLRNALLLIWDFLRPPVFHFNDGLPGSEVVLGIVLHYQLGLELLTVWVLGWGLLFSVRRKEMGRRRATASPVLRAELAFAVGVPETTLRALEACRLIEVDIGEDARIASVRAWPRPAAVS